MKIFKTLLPALILLLLQNSLNAQSWAFSSLEYISQNPSSQKVCNDKNEDIYIVGTITSDSFTMGRGFIKKTAYGSSCAIKSYIFKFNSQGDALWVKTSKTTDSFPPRLGCSVFNPHYIHAITSYDNFIYVCGAFAGQYFQFDSISIRKADTTNHLFLAKFDLNGKIIWVKTSDARSDGIRGMSDGISMDLICDNNGNIYMASSMGDSLVFGNVKLKRNFTSAFSVLKFDTNGNALWGKVLQGDLESYNNKIALDNLGNLLVTGVFTGTSYIIGSYNLPNNGEGDMYLIKFDTNGNVKWATRGGGLKDDYGIGVAADLENNVYVYVSSRTATDFIIGNSGPYIQNNANDLLIKYDANGNYIWSRFMGSLLSSDAGYNSFISDKKGNIYFSGTVRNGLTITDANVTLNCLGGTYPNSTCAYIVEYSKNGNFVWSNITSTNSINGRVNLKHISILNNDLYLTGGVNGANYLNSIPLINNSNPWINHPFLAKYSGILTKIDNKESDNKLINLYPNPTSSQVSLDIKNVSEIKDVYIYDLSGKKYTALINRLNGGINIDVSALSKGTYTLYLETENNVENKRFIKE